jgi:uncharacterized membrane protein
MEEQQSIRPDNGNQGQSSISENERLGSLIAGGAMVLLGLRQRSLRGVLMSLAGGGLAYHGATGQKSLKDTIQTQIEEKTDAGQAVRVERTIAIQNQSPETLYRYWRNLENLPTFMKHLKSVTVTSPTRSHWVANAPLGNTVEWDAEIMSDQENQLISWASVEGSDIENSGFVRFQPISHDRGTAVKVVIEYRPPAGAVGVAFAKLFGEEPEQQIADELRRFKMLMESGEIATTEGQPTGKR